MVSTNTFVASAVSVCKAYVKRLAVGLTCSELINRSLPMSLKGDCTCWGSNYGPSVWYANALQLHKPRARYTYVLSIM